MSKGYEFTMEGTAQFIMEHHKGYPEAIKAATDYLEVASQLRESGVPSSVWHTREDYQRVACPLYEILHD